MDIDDIEERKNLLDRTYEYCTAQFAAYESVKSGKFYTPSSIVKTIDAILKPFSNCHVYDIILQSLIQKFKKFEKCAFAVYIYTR